MMPEFKKMLMNKAKEGKFLSEDEKAGKQEVLDAIKALVSDSMGDELKGLKKVTVASPTEEGLEKGLEVAQDKIGEMSEEDEESEDKPMMAMSKEDKIKKLEEELAALKGDSEAMC